MLFPSPNLTTDNIDGVTRYHDVEINFVHGLLNSQLPGALLSAGFGVLLYPDDTSLQVTPGTGLSVNAAIGAANVNSSIYGPVSIVNPTAFALTGLPANSTVYVFAGCVVNATQDSRTDRQGVVFYSATPAVDGAECLAQVVIGATTITTINDRRNKLSRFTDGGVYDAGRIYYAQALVRSAGNAWLAKRQVVAVTPVEGADWTLFSSRGDAGAGYGGTSTTSNAIGTGSKTFATQAGLAYSVGARARVSSSASPTNWLEGLVTAYSGTTLTINVDATNGSGTFASWNLNIGGATPADASTSVKGVATLSVAPASATAPIAMGANDPALFQAAERTKLTGIETGATQNDNDANLKNRANHTGTQATSTVTGLDTALAAKEATANKDASGGYAGLTLFKINFKNALNTVTSFFANANTVARTYTFQDRSGTIADDTDLALKAPLVHTHAFADLTAKPATLAGYGVQGIPVQSRATGYYNLRGAQTSESDVLLANQRYFWMPFWIEETPLIIIGVRVFVAVAGAVGSTVSIGIAQNNAGVLGNQLYEFGSVATDTTGWKEILFAAVTLPTGAYFANMLHLTSSTAATLTCYRGNSGLFGVGAIEASEPGFYRTNVNVMPGVGNLPGGTGSTAGAIPRLRFKV